MYLAALILSLYFNSVAPGTGLTVVVESDHAQRELPLTYALPVHSFKLAVLPSIRGCAYPSTVLLFVPLTVSRRVWGGNYPSGFI